MQEKLPPPTSVPPVYLREMRAEDKTTLLSILRTTPEFKSSEVMVAEEILTTFLEQQRASGYHVWVALAEGEAVCRGYVCFGQTPLTEETWDIYWIVVETSSRGMGIGRKLLQHAEEEIGGTGGRMILVETSSKDNYRETRRFYTQMGYREIGIIADFYAPGDGKITVQKLLR